MQKKIIAIFILLSLVLIGTGYYLLYGMKTISGSLNVNKITMVDKLYSYSVYSDFYYRATKYDKDGNKKAEFSELQPIRTSIGYDLKNNKAELVLKSNTSNSEKIILSGKDDNNLIREIDMFNSFQKTFGNIVATQDEDYIKKSFKHTKDTLANLYSIDKELDYKKAEDFYHEIKDLPIANMRVKYFQLDAINRNLVGKMKVASKDKWQPNILEWNFGGNNRIYLQYLNKLKNNDIDSYLAKMAKNNKTIIKLVKINNNKLQKMFLKKEDAKNKITTYYLDENGYLYILIFKANHPNAFKKYINDYLKIAYGIYFTDISEFDNWFAKKQKEKDESLQPNNNHLASLLICNKALDKYIGNDLLKFFNVQKSSIEIYTIDGKDYPCEALDKLSELVLTKEMDYDKYFKYYDKLYLDTSKIEKLYNDKKLIYNSIIKLTNWFTNGQKKLKELCQNGDIECIQKLKNNNWEY